MQNINKLVKVYKLLLESVDCVIDTDGNVLGTNGKGESSNITLRVNGKVKQLVLPTESILTNADWDKVVAFHPCAESIIKGQSEVLNLLQSLISKKLYAEIQRGAVAIATLGNDSTTHTKLNLAQMDIVSKFGGTNNSTMKFLQSVIAKCTGISGKFPLFTTVLKRGGTIDGTKYSRTCLVNAGILKWDGNVYNLTTGSMKSNATIKSIYELLFPEVLQWGSSDGDIPYLESLLLMYSAMGNHLNGIADALGKFKMSMGGVNLSWSDELDKLGEYKRQYLPQPLEGNTGVVLREKAVASDNTAKPSGNKGGYAITIPDVTSPKQITPVNDRVAVQAVTSPVVEPVRAGGLYDVNGNPVSSHNVMTGPNPSPQQYQQPMQPQVQPQQYRQPVQQPMQPQQYRQPVQQAEPTMAEMMNRSSMQQQQYGGQPQYGMQPPMQPQYGMQSQQYQQPMQSYGGRVQPMQQNGWY